MAPGSYGLVVEGSYDVDFYRVLVARISGNEPLVEPLRAGGSELYRRFPGLLRSLEHIVAGNPVEVALVIKDADGRPVDDVEAELEGRVKGQLFVFPRGVRFCAVQQEMETWLLADELAINDVSRNRGKQDGVSRIPGDLEDVVGAKEQFQRVLSKAGLDYTPAVCAEIGGRVDLVRLRDRCPSFRRLQDKILGK